MELDWPDKSPEAPLSFPRHRVSQAAPSNRLLRPSRACLSLRAFQCSPPVESTRTDNCVFHRCFRNDDPSCPGHKKNKQNRSSIPVCVRRQINNTNSLTHPAYINKTRVTRIQAEKNIINFVHAPLPGCQNQTKPTPGRTIIKPTSHVRHSASATTTSDTEKNKQLSAAQNKH